MGHDIFNNTQDALALSRKFEEGRVEMDPEDTYCVIFSVGATNEAAGLMAICFDEEPDPEEVNALLTELGSNDEGLFNTGVTPLYHYEEVCKIRKDREERLKTKPALDQPIDVLLTYGANANAIAILKREDVATVWHAIKQGYAGIENIVAMTSYWTVIEALTDYLEEHLPEDTMRVMNGWFERNAGRQIHSEANQSLSQHFVTRPTQIVWFGRDRIRELLRNDEELMEVCNALKRAAYIQNVNSPWRVYQEARQVITTTSAR